MCAATVVVEARERSGALITADLALELGRDVFAVPGEITAGLSAGTNGLIRQGAAPLLHAEDVLAALGVEGKRAGSSTRVSHAAATVAALLADRPRGIDELVRAGDHPAAEVAAALVELELAGLACQVDGVYRPTAA